MPVDSPAGIRWGCWLEDSEEVDIARFAGDGGTILETRNGKSRLFPSPTRENLRCIEYSGGERIAYAVGNHGAMLATREGGAVEQIQTGIAENLRRIAPRPGEPQESLVVGNGGTALFIRADKITTIHGAITNLRAVAWHPSGDYALVCGNCFQTSAGGLSPSVNLFRYDAGEETLLELHSLPESRADLTAASWLGDGSRCLIVGYDQTWHTATVSWYDGTRVSEVCVGEMHIFPTSSAWHPSEEFALIGTSVMRKGEGDGAVYQFQDGKLTKVLDLNGAGVAGIAWSARGKALIVGSTSLRAFSA